MSTSVADTIRHLEDLKQRAAVWTELVSYLYNCLDSETSPAKNGIEAPGCVRPNERVGGRENVPQSVISQVVECIKEEKIQPLMDEIEALEKLPVVETKDEKPKPSIQPPPKGAAPKPQKVQARVGGVPSATRGQS